MTGVNLDLYKDYKEDLASWDEDMTADKKPKQPTFHKPQTRQSSNYPFNPIVYSGKQSKTKEKIMVHKKLHGNKPYELNYETMPTGGWRDERQRVESFFGFHHQVPEAWQANFTKMAV
jgi:hypothetical protein